MQFNLNSDTGLKPLVSVAAFELRHRAIDAALCIQDSSGGIALENPVGTANLEYNDSLFTTDPLVLLILEGECIPLSVAGAKSQWNKLRVNDLEPFAYTCLTPRAPIVHTSSTLLYHPFDRYGNCYAEKLL